MCADCPAELAKDLDGSFATLVAHHQDLVYGVALRWTHCRADAEDLAQEAFLRAYRALGEYEPARIAELRLRGWLARITLNLARNRARDADPSAADITDVLEPTDRSRDRPEQISERREASRTWSRLLATLPPRYRAAVGLRHVDGLSYQELAVALDKPVGTVKSDVHRGVALLRAAYESELMASTGMEAAG